MSVEKEIKSQKTYTESEKLETRKSIEEAKKVTPSKVVKALVNSSFIGDDFHSQLVQEDVKKLYKNSGIKFGGIY